MSAIPMNGQFMSQFYTTQPAPGTQDGYAWAPNTAGARSAAPQQQQYANYAPQQQQYAGYPPQQQYAGYAPQQQQYAGYPPQQQQGWGQQVAYQQYPQGPMGYPPQGPMGYPGAQGPMGYPPQGPMGGPRPGSVPWMPARPTSSSPFGAGPEGLLAILQQFGGLDDLGGLLPEDVNPYVSARPDPQGRGVDMVVNRLAGLVNQISDVINQLGSVVATLVNKQQTVAVLPPAVPPTKPATVPTPPPATAPKDGSIEALLAALGFGGAAPAAPADNTVAAANPNESENDRLIAELLGQIA